MYTAPPTEELTIDDFEMFALDRLQLLRGLELLKTRGYVDEDMKNKIRQVGAKSP
jgi:DNA primase large subunit